MSEGSAQVEPSTPAVASGEVKVDEQQQQRIQAFLRTSRLIVLIMLVPMVVIEVFVLFSLFPPLFSSILTSPWLALQPVPGWSPLEILAIYLSSVIFFVAFFSPFVFVLSYILPKRYKIQKSTFSVWLRNWLRAAGRFIVNWFCFVQCLCLLFVIQPNLWWLWMALLLGTVSVIRTYLAPLHAFRNLKRTPLTDERLVNTLDKLCKTHKTNIHHFSLLESKKPGQLVRANAYLAGWGKTSSILLTSGLLKAFQYGEIKSIVAHELGHHVYRHLIKRQLLNFGLWLGELFLYYTFYHWFLALFASSDSSSSVGIALLVMVFLALGIRLSCFMARKKYRRKNEFWADEFALRATLDVPAFKNAMIRLGNLNDMPFKLTPRQERGLTHPTTTRRLEHANEFAVRLAKARETTSRA